MYIPDHTIARRLFEYDDKLSVRWMPNKERWGIYRKVASANNLYDHTVLVMTVRDEEGNYLPLDERVLDHIAEADWHRLSDTNAKARFKDIEEFNVNREEKILADNLSEMEDITKDIAPTVMQEMSEDMGANNMPKEDARKELEARYGEDVLA